MDFCKVRGIDGLIFILHRLNFFTVQWTRQEYLYNPSKLRICVIILTNFIFYILSGFEIHNIKGKEVIIYKAATNLKEIGVNVRKRKHSERRIPCSYQTSRIQSSKKKPIWTCKHEKSITKLQKEKRSRSRKFTRISINIY